MSRTADRDLIAELGYLTLGSRFRRLGERLQSGVAELARAEGIAAQPAQFPVLAALAEKPMTIGALVERLDLSQPGITRSVGRLVADGLVEPLAGDGGDMRQRTVGLSPRGRALLDRANARIFPHVERAVAAMCAGTGLDLLGYLDRLDAALAETPLDQRARALRDGKGSE
ncbi:MarR family winged helix-turn-helix transcriptional regulator [Novosphingobium album (ex Liu et al. 2023)]|uniref:MarR family transcriptional regulator n=1 Tax=Novosphingobium album (ex Liu et al. 2023) TaxID=3031130 RepID=A0ABT5WRN6_9SPHN|nr:MarR family transcriptional regulator [Novosphingobium album (ex Liu et al. 2023)]MDE8652696.1 MarR family transcriptional regulator [Novosphingobium album (ex Liu et al. 2023)]